MRLSFSLFLIEVALVASGQLAIPRYQNSISDTEIVYKPKDDKFIQKCKITGKPLDLLFIIDASGSLRDQFDDQLQIVRNVVNEVAISPSATRVALIQYSKRPHTVFHFNTFNNRADILNAVNNMKTSAGLTYTGAAINYSKQEWQTEYGMRDGTVPRIAFLLSDGRAYDWPTDVTNATEVSKQFGVEWVCFGLGEYIAWDPLRQIAGGRYDRVVNSNNASAIADWFAPWKGEEVCEPVPICIPGSEKPLDLLFIIDSSDSVGNSFNESIIFTEKVVSNINVDPQAVRVALITYGSLASVEFKFDDYTDNAAVLNKLREVQPKYGTTNTPMALKEAYDLFESIKTERNASVPKVAIVITDGHSTEPPIAMARRLTMLQNITVIAVSVVDQHLVSFDELLSITGGHSDRIFQKGVNLIDFDQYFLQYADLACPELGINVTDAIKVIRPPFELTCDDKGVSITVRTKNLFNGIIFPIGYDTKSQCVTTGDGTNRETKIFYSDQTCGIIKKISENNTYGYSYSLRLGIRFHPDVETIVDASQPLSCTVNSQANLESADNFSLKGPKNAKCTYKIRDDTGSCELLDAPVGKMIKHEWDCDLASNYRILVHDCRADSDDQIAKTLNLLDSDGCEIDPVLLQTPVYNLKSSMVTQKTEVFKFTSATTLRMRCLISVCDMDTTDKCTTAIPPQCLNRGPNYNSSKYASQPIDYSNPALKDGFLATIGVEARRLNIYEKMDMEVKNENIAYRQFCSSLL